MQCATFYRKERKEGAKGTEFFADIAETLRPLRFKKSCTSRELGIGIK